MSSTYKVGELIWAKMKGFSWWPGMICEPLPSMIPPKRTFSFHCVYFFGSNDYGWVTEKAILPYKEAKDNIVKLCTTAAFKEAVHEIEEYIEHFECGDIRLKQEDLDTKDRLIKKELHEIKQEEHSIYDDQTEISPECKKDRPSYIIPKMFDPKVVLERIDIIKCKKCTCHFFNLKDYRLHTLKHVKKEGDYFCNNNVNYKIEDLKTHKVKQEIKEEPKLKSNDTKIARNPKSSKIAANSKIKTKKVEIQKRKTKNSTHECAVCNKTFNNKTNVAVHMRIHTGERPFRCDECGKRFNQPSTLTLHQKRHVGFKDFFCKTCHKAFYDKGSLTLHERTHTGIKPYKCVYCGKKFSDPSAFARHLRTHTGCKPYCCNRCPKTFSDASALIQHRKRHTNIKEFTCSICEKDFYTNDAMNKHIIAVHSGRKIFECSVCNKKFALKQYLQIHYSNVHVKEKKFECDHCGTKFIHKHQLDKHIKIEHSLIFRYCKSCKRPFASKDEYKKHKHKCSFIMSQCKICNKTFRNCFKLSSHMNDHSKSKPKHKSVCRDKAPNEQYLVHEKENNFIANQAKKHV